MPSLKEIKGRIASVNSTRKITSAMKMVANSKLHHAQVAIQNMLPYETMLEHILKSFLAAEAEAQTVFDQPRPVKRAALVVFSSNSSLCGGFNSNVIKRMQQTVAEFIDAALAGDDAHFVNPDLEATYEAYFALYDQGLDQNAIVLALLNGEDRTVADVTAKYSTEKYELTVHNFSDALTTTDSWLVNYVPRAILVFHTKRLQMRRGEITRMLKEAATPEEMNEQFEKLNQLTEIEKNINIKLGRLKK